MKWLMPKDIRIIFEEKGILVENAPVNVSQLLTLERSVLDNNGKIAREDKPVDHEGVGNKAQQDTMHHGEKPVVHALAGFPTIVFYSGNCVDMNGGLQPAVIWIYATETDRDEDYNRITKDLAKL